MEQERLFPQAPPHLPRQLINYREFLKDGGEIYFKTDDDDLFRDSLEYFPASGYDIEWMTFDLHENEPEWNIRTEHEACSPKWASRSRP